jgi:hypothetical protein
MDPRKLIRLHIRVISKVVVKAFDFALRAPYLVANAVLEDWV